MDCSVNISLIYTFYKWLNHSYEYALLWHTSKQEQFFKWQLSKSTHRVMETRLNIWMWPDVYNEWMKELIEDYILLGLWDNVPAEVFLQRW